MAVYYTAGEQKIRPGIYQRYSKQGTGPVAGANDGICAIPVQSIWGPLGKVTAVTSQDELYKKFGEGDYSSKNTVSAASEMFSGGANKVYVYRMGSGGTESTCKLSLASEEGSPTEAVSVASKYPGTYPLSVSVQEKIGVAGKKEFKVYSKDTLLETFLFDADGTNEPKNLCDAVKSEYVNLTKAVESGKLANVSISSGELTGGTDPTVVVGDYSKAFTAFEPFYYNTIALDVDDDENLSKGLLLAAYLANAQKTGKLGMAVIGEKTTVDFATRCQHAKSFNDEKVVYLGNGYVDTARDHVEGVKAICYTAGLIAATPTNQGIVHTVVKGATDVIEQLSNSQYEDAIKSGMLLLSVSADGQVWYDSGVNTLISLSADQDEGWKKIRRAKTRMELFDRLDRTLAPKVGKINCDPDGVGDVIQTAQRVLILMEDERKLYTGSKFVLDETLGYAGDSAWYRIETVDIDSLEKIYLHYMFSYAQA